MPEAKVISLNREIVAKCPNCKDDMFYILVNKPEFDAITGFRCVDCGEIIEIEITKQ